MTNDTKRVRILTETHEHAGQLVDKDSELDLDTPTADHLIAIGAAAAVGSTSESSSRSTRKNATLASGGLTNDSGQ
jgi:hypothetical protein